MPDPLSPLFDIYRTHLDACCRITGAVLSGTEKIERMFLETAQRAVDELG